MGEAMLTHFVDYLNTDQEEKKMLQECSMYSFSQKTWKSVISITLKQSIILQNFTVNLLI